MVRLQEQPFQVLLALLDRPGEVVTREELRERLWPGDSFGEFDQGLNTAIAKLREALGDSAANPRYVETLPKRGYRFVHRIESDGSAAAVEAPAPVKAGTERRRYYIAAFLAVAACILAVPWIIRRPPPDPQRPLRRFALRFPAPTSANPDARLVAVSPDGKHIAIIDREKKNTVWIQDLDRQKPRMIEGTEGASTLFWSPDSSMIGFGVEKGKLWKVSVKGGPAVLLCERRTHISGASWNPDGSSIVFTSGTPSSLYVVAATGGTPTLVVSPQMLPEQLGESTQRQVPASGRISHPRVLPAEGVLRRWSLPTLVQR